MDRVIKAIVGVALIGYGIYSGNSWFYLGIIPLLVGITGWCPMKKMMGSACTEEGCNDTAVSAKETKVSSCCATPDEQVQAFKETK